MSLSLIILCATIGVASGAGVLPEDSVVTLAGNTVNLTTSLAQGPTELHFLSWNFGSKNISTLDAGVIYVDPEYEGRIAVSQLTGSLQVKNVSVKDSGEYTVSIRPTEGNATVTGNTTLNVYEEITNVVLYTSTSNAIEGLPLNLTCDALGSILTREWMINSTEVTPSDNIEFLDQNRVLSFKVLRRYDLGKITCRVKNPLHQVSNHITMTVNYGPDDLRTSGQILRDNTVKLTCSTESEPRPKYTWTKNGRIMGNSQNLYTYDNKPSDSGEYICRATNPITMKSSEASIIVVFVEVPREGLPAGGIVGITLASVIVVAGAAAGGYFIYKCKTNTKSKNKRLQLEHANGNNSKIGNIYTEKENKHAYDNNIHIYEDTFNYNDMKK